MADSKHLDFLQAAIGRMAGNSFLAKGWSITLTTLLIGFAAKEGGAGFALIALVPVLLFALVDAYYLALEKGFRDRFKVAAETYRTGGDPDFNMDPSFGFGRLVTAALRPAVYLVHGPLVLVLVLAYCRLSGRL